MGNTIKRTVNLNQFDSVKVFNQAAMQADFDIDISHNRYVIDAKSLMGLFSLDLSKPQNIEIYATEEEAAAFLEAIAPFIIN
jgi:phosphotransferase system HPr-like phosphotransfer protein